jgi:hypothetical protein
MKNETKTNNNCNLWEEWDLSFIEDSKTSNQQKVINSICREIELIKQRDDLELKRIKKKFKGKVYEVNESRFWKISKAEPNKLNVSIKCNSHTLKLDNSGKRKYLDCENDKGKLIELLEKIKTNFLELDSTHSVFNQIKK